MYQKKHIRISDVVDLSWGVTAGNVPMRTVYDWGLYGWQVRYMLVNKLVPRLNPEPVKVVMVLCNNRIPLRKVFAAMLPDSRIQRAEIVSIVGGGGTPISPLVSQYATLSRRLGINPAGPLMEVLEDAIVKYDASSGILTIRQYGLDPVSIQV